MSLLVLGPLTVACRTSPCHSSHPSCTVHFLLEGPTLKGSLSGLAPHTHFPGSIPTEDPTNLSNASSPIGVFLDVVYYVTDAFPSLL